MQKTHKEYGVNQRTQISNELSGILEELKIQGYAVIENVVDQEFLEEARLRLDLINTAQESSFGREKLIEIQELDLVRCPLAYDEFFLKVIAHPRILEIANALIGGMQIVHLQNGIINRPREAHHQSSWHRDLPYQDFRINRPLAMGALWCIDPFDSSTGATWVLPYSHQLEILPSLEYTEKHKVQVQAKPGSVVVFDSMLYHCAGYNHSDIIRRAINNVYVTPILKQQINIPALLNGKYLDDPELAGLLGYLTPVAESIEEFRNNRWLKIQNTKV